MKQRILKSAVSLLLVAVMVWGAIPLGVIATTDEDGMATAIPLALGIEKSLLIDNSDMLWFSFTPQKSGGYTLTVKNTYGRHDDYFRQLYLYDENGDAEWVSYVSEDEDCKLATRYLEEGHIYYCFIDSNLYESDVSSELKVIMESYDSGDIVMLGDKVYSCNSYPDWIVIGDKAFNFPWVGFYVCHETIVFKDLNNFTVINKNLEIVFEKSNICYGADLGGQEDFINQDKDTIIFYEPTNSENVYKKYRMSYNYNQNSFGEPIFLEDCNINKDGEPNEHDPSENSIVFGNKVDLEYPKKYLGLANDTDVPPIPMGSNAQYIEELKYWANEFGYDFSDLDYNKALQERVKMPLFTKDNEVIFEDNSLITIKDLMASIIMLGKMQPYLIEEENNSIKAKVRGKDPATQMNNSTQKMLEFLDRYNKFIGDQPDEVHDPRTATKALASIEKIINTTWGTNFSSAKLLDKYTSQIINLKPEFNDIMSTLKSAKNNDTLYNAQNDLLDVVNQGVNIYQGDYYDAIGGLITELNNSSLLNVKSYTDTVKDSYDFIKLIGTDLGPAMAASKISKTYIDFCVYMITWIKDQYPSWLFYSHYYLPMAYPDYFTQMGLDKNGELQLQSYNSFSAQQINDCDALGSLLLSTYNMEGKIQQQTVLAHQSSVSVADKRSAITAATTLSEIRQTNYRDMQKYLLDFINAQCVPNGKTKTANFHCPVIVTMIDQDGNEVFTLGTDDEYTQNYNEYCTFYLSGDSRDKKTFIYNGDYDFKVVPYANGKMDCSIQTTDESGQITEYFYSDVPVDSSTEFLLTTTMGIIPTLEKITGDNSSEILATSTTVLAEDVTLDTDEIELYMGDTKQLKAQVLPIETTDKTVTWRSTNPDIATVDENGLVTAISAGRARIVVKSNASDATDAYHICEVTVLPRTKDLTKISFKATKGGDIRFNDDFKGGKFLIGSDITFFAIPDEGYVFTGWTSSNGGEFSDVEGKFTHFTVPSKSTTVTASFAPESAEDEPSPAPCNCCDNHTHGNSIFDILACFFCKIWQFVCQYFNLSIFAVTAPIFGAVVRKPIRQTLTKLFR